MWIGITLKMGTLGRARASHYWSKDGDFGNDVIKASMKENRYAAITANLSFAPRGTASGWPKISWLDGVLRSRCRAACGITQHATVDESMIKMLSKFCPWLQYMPKKPIKWGKCMCVQMRVHVVVTSDLHVHGVLASDCLQTHIYDLYMQVSKYFAWFCQPAFFTIGTSIEVETTH